MFTAVRALRGFLTRKNQRPLASALRHNTRLTVEALEDRRVLAVSANIPVIMGTVFEDLDANMSQGPSESGIAGAIVQLYRDVNDNQQFDDGIDVQEGIDFTTLMDDPGTAEDESGTYCFDNLDPNSGFFVVQPSQSVNGLDLNAMVSGFLEPSVPDLMIDDFVTTQAPIVAEPPAPPTKTDESSQASPESLGGERDLAVELLVSLSGEIEVEVNPFPNAGFSNLFLNSDFGVEGRATITWDGEDGDGDGLAFGLGGVDLTNNGENTGFVLRLGTDANGGQVQVFVYTGDADTFSEAPAPTETISIPRTGGDATGFLYVPFTDFVGSADFTSVDAIQLVIGGEGSAAVDAAVDLIGVLGPEVQNFANAVQVDLELIKTVEGDVTTVNNGSTVDWLLTLTNNPTNGNSPATGVQVTDALPSELSLVNATTANGGFDPLTGIWTLVDPINPGESAALSLETTVNGDVAGGTIIDNIAQVTALAQVDFDSDPTVDGDPDEDDEAIARVTVGEFIDLELSKDITIPADGLVDAGDPVTFTLTLTNNEDNANASATGVQVTDVIQAGLTLNDTTTLNGAYANDVWTLANPLAPGETATLQLMATVDDDVVGGANIPNSAEVTTANENDSDSTPGNNNLVEDDQAAVALMVGAQIDLMLVKSADLASPKTVDVGQVFDWTLTLTNEAAAANTAATGVEVTDLLPAGLTLQNATTANGAFADNVWTLANPIPPGGTATLTLTTQVDAISGATLLTNTAQVTAANEPDVDSQPDVDGDPDQDDESTDSVTVNAVIDLELSKTVSANTVSDGEAAMVNAGDQVTWTVSLTNNADNANAPATGVQVTDNLPDGLTFVSSNATNGSFSNGLWTLTDALAPGVTETLTLVGTVNNGIAGDTTLNNLAEVSAALEADFDSQPNDDTTTPAQDDEDDASITIEPVIDLEVQKTAAPTSVVEAGSTITWTVDVTNNAENANTPATDVVIRDVLPSGVTFVSSDTDNGAYDVNTGLWTLTSALAVGESSSLTIVTTVNEGVRGQQLQNLAEVSGAGEDDTDSEPGTGGDLSEDDAADASVNVRAPRPISKRELLASSIVNLNRVQL